MIVKDYSLKLLNGEVINCSYLDNDKIESLLKTDFWTKEWVEKYNYEKFINSKGEVIYKSFPEGGMFFNSELDAKFILTQAPSLKINSKNDLLFFIKVSKSEVDNYLDRATSKQLPIKKSSPGDEIWELADGRILKYNHYLRSALLFESIGDFKYINKNLLNSDIIIGVY